MWKLDQKGQEEMGEPVASNCGGMTVTLTSMTAVDKLISY